MIRMFLFKSMSFFFRKSSRSRHTNFSRFVYFEFELSRNETWANIAGYCSYFLLSMMLSSLPGFTQFSCDYKWINEEILSRISYRCWLHWSWKKKTLSRLSSWLVKVSSTGQQIKFHSFSDCPRLAESCKLLPSFFFTNTSSFLSCQTIRWWLPVFFSLSAGDWVRFFSTTRYCGRREQLLGVSRFYRVFFSLPSCAGHGKRGSSRVFFSVTGTGSFDLIDFVFFFQTQFYRV